LSARYNSISRRILKVIGEQLTTEERASRDQPSTRLPDAAWAAVSFVPGSASVGELRDRHGAGLDGGGLETAGGGGGGGPRSCSASKCRCGHPSAAAVPRVDRSTSPPVAPSVADKAVNTKARGLMHNGGVGGAGGGRRTARAASIELVTVTSRQGPSATQPADEQ